MIVELRSYKSVAVFTVAMVVFANVASNVLTRSFFDLGQSPNALHYTLITTTLVSTPLVLFTGFLILQATQIADRLAALVDRDTLTEVATRDYFYRRLDDTPDAYGVSLMVDIDHFKAINDTHGHIAGDTVIRAVAQALQAQVRDRDVVCRFGGEEFVIFLFDVDESIGRDIAERMRASIARHPITIGSTRIAVTVSIGGSYKERVEDFGQTITLADRALYQAKEMGRNRIAFFPRSVA